MKPSHGSIDNPAGCHERHRPRSAPKPIQARRSSSCKFHARTSAIKQRQGSSPMINSPSFPTWDLGLDSYRPSKMVRHAREEWAVLYSLPYTPCSWPAPAAGPPRGHVVVGTRVSQSLACVVPFRAATITLCQSPARPSPSRVSPSTIIDNHIPVPEINCT